MFRMFISNRYDKIYIHGGHPGSTPKADLTKDIHVDRKSPGGVGNGKHSGLNRKLHWLKIKYLRYDSLNKQNQNLHLKPSVVDKMAIRHAQVKAIADVVAIIDMTFDLHTDNLRYFFPKK